MRRRIILLLLLLSGPAQAGEMEEIIAKLDAVQAKRLKALSDFQRGELMQLLARMEYDKLGGEEAALMMRVEELKKKEKK